MELDFRKFCAEVIGTFILICFGCGSVAMTLLFQSNIESQEIVFGGYTNIVFGWALGVTFGVIASLRISGAHLNPAVTLAFAFTNRFSWKKVPYYIIAQLLGAFLGALLVFIVFYAKWVEFDPTFSYTAGIFATFPAVKSSLIPGLVDQIFGTFLLVFLLLCALEYIKNPEDSLLLPFIVGAIVLAIGISFGGMHGYAINPARDFGPRLFSLISGFNNTGFENGVWIIPIVGPILGGILGAKLFDWSIKQ